MLDLEVTERCVNPEGSFGREMDPMKLAPSVRFGFELALWSLYARAEGKTLPEAVSPRPADSVPVSALVSGPPDEALRGARRARDAGYRAVKLKVGAQTVGGEVELVRAASDALGNAVSLRLDANRAWSFEAAAAFARATADVEYEYVEEPLAEPAGLPDLALEHGLPVALDESLVGLEPEELEKHRYARAVVLKPTLLGGLSRTLRFARKAAELGITPIISSAYETGVGTRALVALAAGIGEEVPAGLDTYRRLAADVLRPRLELPAPRVDVQAMMGAGREIEPGRLRPIG